MSKLSTRVPASVLREEQAARMPPEQGVPVERDATLNKRNIPEFAGEAPPESPITSPSRIAQYGSNRGGFPRPHLPIIATPEEVQIFQNRMPILKEQARIQGLHSAGFGKVGVPEDYPTRVGRSWMRQFGPPENLMEESETPPVRRKVENE